MSVIINPRNAGFAILGFAFATVFGLGTAAAADCVRPKGLQGTTPHVISFDLGSIEISDEEKAWLKDQADRFASHPSLEVCVIGQADKTGDPDVNKQISMERAEAVAAFLKDNGLADKKFQVIGRGEAFGDTSDSLVGKLLDGALEADRRVEVVLYK